MEKEPMLQPPFHVCMVNMRSSRGYTVGAVQEPLGGSLKSLLSWVREEGGDRRNKSDVGTEPSAQIRPACRRPFRADLASGFVCAHFKAGDLFGYFAFKCT